MAAFILYLTEDRLFSLPLYSLLFQLSSQAKLLLFKAACGRGLWVNTMEKDALAFCVKTADNFNNNYCLYTAKRAKHFSEKWVRSFPMIWIKGTDESTMGNDFAVSLMHHDPSEPGSLILIFPKEHTL